jgi:membrane dipeptidase
MHPGFSIIAERSHSLNRREFTLAALELSAAALMAPRLLARAHSATDIAELYKNAIVIDTLCGPVLDLDKPPGPELLAAIRQSGITGVSCTVSERNLEGTISNLASLEVLVGKFPETFAMVRKHSDIAVAKRDNKVGILPGSNTRYFWRKIPSASRCFAISACASCRSPITRAGPLATVA